MTTRPSRATSGEHRYNYAEIPIYEMIYGTVRDPRRFERDTGFYHGASARIFDMLTFRDVPSPDAAESTPFKEAS